MIARDEIHELGTEQAITRKAGDSLGRAVHEEDPTGIIEHDHPISPSLEVFLERIDPA